MTKKLIDASPDQILEAILKNQSPLPSHYKEEVVCMSTNEIRQALSTLPTVDEREVRPLPPEVVAYMRHKDDCNSLRTKQPMKIDYQGYRICTCGLDALLAKITPTDAMVERIAEAVTQGLSINPGIILGNSAIKLLTTAIRTALKEGGEHGT